jgi:hypothetical protein
LTPTIYWRQGHHAIAPSGGAMAQITTMLFIDAVSGGGMKSKQLAKK